MPLFKVRFEIELMVVADSAEKAGAIVLEGGWASEEVHNGLAYAHEVKSLSEVSVDWQESIPWGATDDLTCKQVLMEALDEKT